MTQQVVKIAELAIHHAVNEYECGAYVDVMSSSQDVSIGALGVDAVCAMVQELNGMELECGCKSALAALDVAQVALQHLANTMEQLGALEGEKQQHKEQQSAVKQTIGAMEQQSAVEQTTTDGDMEQQPTMNQAAAAMGQQ